MNIIAKIFEQFEEREIGFDALRHKLDELEKQDINKTHILNYIEQSDYSSLFTDTQLIKLKQHYSETQTIELSDEETLIRPLNTSPDNSNTQTFDDEDKTRIKPSTDNEITVVLANNVASKIDDTESDNTQRQDETLAYEGAGFENYPDPDAQPTIVSRKPNINNQTTPSTKLEPGHIVNDRFVLERLLGQGGMGSVFMAKDLRKEEANDNNPYIAIKFLNEDFKQHPQSLISLQREAKKSQTLAHPNIITVHDFDRDGDTVYMTMEFLEGEPLDVYLFNHRNSGIEKDTALKIIKDISQALSYAHQKNIVHSDFKPGNIFVSVDGTAKVLDFGIARAVKNTGDNVSGDKTMFDAGELGGLTPTYASLEMLQGKEPAAADDVYALACVAYELLAGYHPYSRLPADQAKEAGKTPVPLKQLDRKQSQALNNALQFERSKRTTDAQTFINQFFIRKQNSKILVFSLTIAAILLLGVGIKYYLEFQQEQHITELVLSIQQGNDSTIEKALPELNSLKGSTRETVLSDIRPIITQYYADKSLPLADQSKGNYNYPGAIAALSDAKKLYPDSAQINDMIVQLVTSQNQLLSTISKQIDGYLQKGKLNSAVSNNDIQNIYELVQIAAPESKLLDDERLLLAYLREIRQSIKAHNFSNADTLLASAGRIFDKNADLLKIEEEFKQSKRQFEEDKKLEKLQNSFSIQGKQITPEMRKNAVKRHLQKLETLMTASFKTDDWPNKVLKEVVALNIFEKKRSLQSKKLRDKASTLFVRKARTLRRNNKLSSARDLLKQAQIISPGLNSLKKESRALAIAERKQQNSQVNREKTAKIIALKEKLIFQAGNNDVKAAESTLLKLKKLATNSRFVKNEAADIIANAYLRLANSLAKRNKLNDALALLNQGLVISSNNFSIKSTIKAYKAEQALIKLSSTLARFKQYNRRTLNQIENQLEIIQTGLPDRYSKIRRNLSNNVLKQIKSLANTDRNKAKKFIEIAAKLFPENSKIVALTRRSSDFQSAGGQPCKTSYAGHGKRTRATCYDLLPDGSNAPLLVVIPGISKTKKNFAISRFEISVAEYNKYCFLTKNCNEQKNKNSNLPITDISLNRINSYLKWLTQTTHSTYRLPTLDEWSHAVKTNTNTTRLNGDFNCRLMLGSKQIKGLELLDVKTGSQNAWGLKNYIGNAQELVSHNNIYYVVGGSISDSLSRCNSLLKRKYSGKQDKLTGFRLIKEL